MGQRIQMAFILSHFPIISLIASLGHTIPAFIDPEMEMEEEKDIISRKLLILHECLL